MKFGKEAASKIYSAKGSLPADKDIRDITSMIFADELWTMEQAPSRNSHTKAEAKKGWAGTGEEIQHTAIFLKLMDESDEFTLSEKKTLVGFAEEGSTIYQASFRVAMHTGNLSYFVRGLQTIVDILGGVEGNSCSSFFEQSYVTLSGIKDFTMCAEELAKSGDITEDQYAILMEAIFARHASAHGLYHYFCSLAFHKLLCKSRKEETRVKFTKGTIIDLCNVCVASRKDLLVNNDVELMPLVEMPNVVGSLSIHQHEGISVLNCGSHKGNTRNITMTVIKSTKKANKLLIWLKRCLLFWPIPFMFITFLTTVQSESAVLSNVTVAVTHDHRTLAGLSSPRTGCGVLRDFLVAALLSFHRNYIDPNSRQSSIVPQRNNARMRIDLQGNGDVVPSGFSANLPPGQLFRQLAVQYEGNSYAGVWVPVGVPIANHALNRAMYYSAANQRVVIFLPNPEITPNSPFPWRLWDDSIRQFVDLTNYRYPSGRHLSSKNETQERDLGIFDPQCPTNEWSPCYNDAAAHDAGLKNRDAAGAAYCRMNGYAGVKPSGYQYCNWAVSYKFQCETHTSRTVSPCYRDEDYYAMNNIDPDTNSWFWWLGDGGNSGKRAGEQWCKEMGHDGTVSSEDCGNWYFKSYCYRWSPCFASWFPWVRDQQGNAYCRDRGFSGFVVWEWCNWFTGSVRYKCQ